VIKKNWIGVSILVCLLLGVVGYKYYKQSNEIKISVKEAGGIYELKGDDFSYLLGKGKPVIIDFTASWCIPCKTFNPILEQTYEKYKDQVIIKIIDADEHKDLVSKLPIRAIPTQLFFNKDGSPYDPSKLGIIGFRGYSKENSDKIDLTVHEGAFTEEELIVVLKDMGVDVE